SSSQSGALIQSPRYDQPEIWAEADVCFGDGRQSVMAFRHI
ncbi:MAG: hypothetical protein ACJA1L_002222, partial [Paracoccaceae bacterium]